MQTWQRLRADEQAIKYVLFAVGICASLLLTGGFNSEPDWISLVINGALVLIALDLGLRAYLRVRHRGCR